MVNRTLIVYIFRFKN